MFHSCSTDRCTHHMVIGIVQVLGGVVQGQGVGPGVHAAHATLCRQDKTCKSAHKYGTQAARNNRDVVPWLWPTCLAPRQWGAVCAQPPGAKNKVQEAVSRQSTSWARMVGAKQNLQLHQGSDSWPTEPGTLTHSSFSAGAPACACAAASSSLWNSPLRSVNSTGVVALGEKKGCNQPGRGPKYKSMLTEGCRLAGAKPVSTHCFSRVGA